MGNHDNPNETRGDSSHVPVSMCSPRFLTVETGGFVVSECWFPPGSVIPRHTHERAVLGVMLEGGFEVGFSRRTLNPGAGDLFTEPGEEAHSNRIGKGGAHVVAIQPDPTDRELSSTCRSLLDGMQSLRHHGVAHSARRLARELKAPDEMADLAIESLALDMLVGAVRFQGGRGEPGWLSRVDQMILDGFRDRLSIIDIAAEAGVHRGHLARVYKQHRGVPIGTHVRHLRLEWAAQQLAGSTASISSVAIRAGFADQSHLTRAFKRRFGVPPGEYRARTQA